MAESGGVSGAERRIYLTFQQLHEIASVDVALGDVSFRRLVSPVSPIGCISAQNGPALVALVHCSSHCPLWDLPGGLPVLILRRLSDRPVCQIHAQFSSMENPRSPRITAVDRLTDGLIIMFDDGRCAHYTSLVLHAALPQAREFGRSEWTDEQVPVTPDA
jgi:hypothetical protein